MTARDLLARQLATADGPLGIMLSGGLDSAVMLAMACDLGHRRWLVRTIPKRDGALEHAQRVLPWINRRYGLDLRLEPAGDPLLHHARQLGHALSLSLVQHPGVTWFSAENRVPDDLPGGPVRRRAADPRVRQPWFDLTKDEIIAAALGSGLEALVSITHSCTERSQGRCGLCWQCGERRWAFDRLGVCDPGDL